MNQSPSSASQFHHIALRVPDPEASKNWLEATLGFGVEWKFQFAGQHFSFFHPWEPSSQ